MTGLICALFAAALLGGVDVRTGVEAWQRGDHAGAVAAWAPLSDRGDAHAQFNLAQAYKLGRGVPADMTKAIDLYRKAAAQGHGEARALLGLILFQNGRRAEAMPFIIEAAEDGEAGAQYVYGTALFNGDVVARNLPLAYAMMTRAAGQGLPPAVVTLAEMDRHMSMADRREGAAMARPARAAAVAPPRPAAPAPRAASVPTAAAPPAGRWRVQLGAFGRPANADALFARLRGGVPALRNSRSYLLSAGAVTRLQAGPFVSRASAESVCRAVRAAGQACFAVAP